MDYHTPEIVAVATYNACQQMQANPADVPKWHEIAMVIGTAAVESGLELSGKIHSPGIGIFGLQYPRSRIFYHAFKMGKRMERFLRKEKYKYAAIGWDIFSRAWLGIGGVPYIKLEQKDLRYLLVHDVRFGAAMCAWTYFNLQTEEPENLNQVADMWAKLYRNGAGEAEEFTKAWFDLECAALMGFIGYQ
jgi:hypothetical protein